MTESKPAMGLAWDRITTQNIKTVIDLMRLNHKIYKSHKILSRLMKVVISGCNINSTKFFVGV
jgi:hypothetical protein